MLGQISFFFFLKGPAGVLPGIEEKSEFKHEIEAQ
jgi:hypothetical protein